MALTNTANFPKKTTENSEILQAILQELRYLRNDMMLFLPQDRLKNYAHPTRLKRSYENATRKHPPAPFSWK